MNTTKFSVLIFAFLLVGAGCLGAKTASETEIDTQPRVEVTQSDNTKSDTGVIKDDIKVDNDEETPVDTAFKMVANPKPATKLILQEDSNIYDQQLLKLDIDADGSLEYAIISTENEKVFDTPYTFQYLRIYKWNGAEWLIIHKDHIDRAKGWFNKYEVTRIDGDNHVFYLEKANSDGPIEEYYFGELEDGSFGKVK